MIILWIDERKKRKHFMVYEHPLKNITNREVGIFSLLCKVVSYSKEGFEVGWDGTGRKNKL